MSATTQYETYETAWCPGCGNFSILKCLKNALTGLELDPHEVLLVSGIGQAAKIPQYISVNGFCGLHGRAMPAGVAAAMVRPDLTVIVETGDGDTYGEGGNHFLHNVRRNVNMAHFVHDNQIYGLTKGQASPTSEQGHVTPVQVDGVISRPVNPLLLALSLGAGFVARGFAGDPEQLTDLMQQAIRYPGYALLDILQPCVSFNKRNTYATYKNRVRPLTDDHDSSDLDAAFHVARDTDSLATGVLYRVEQPDFHTLHPVLKDQPPLLERPFPEAALEEALASLR